MDKQGRGAYMRLCCAFQASRPLANMCPSHDLVQIIIMLAMAIELPYKMHALLLHLVTCVARFAFAFTGFSSVLRNVTTVEVD